MIADTSDDSSPVWYAPLSALIVEPTDVPGVTYDFQTMMVSIRARDANEAIQKAEAFFQHPFKEVADMEAALESLDLIEPELPIFRGPDAAGL